MGLYTATSGRGRRLQQEAGDLPSLALSSPIASGVMLAPARVGRRAVGKWKAPSGRSGALLFDRLICLRKGSVGGVVLARVP